MAVQTSNHIGFVTGGLEEASASIGSPLVVTDPVRTGVYSLELQAGDNIDFPFLSGSLSDNGNDYIIGFGFRTPSATPTVDVDIVAATDDSGVAIFKLRWEATSGDLIIVDEQGTEVDTITNPFTADTWHWIEIIFERAASGAADVNIDGSASGLSVTATDFDAGNAFDFWKFRSPSSGPTIYIDDIYMRNGAAGTSDFHGPRFEVLGGFQNTVEDATDQGTTLGQGTWAVAGDTPWGDEAAGSQAGYTGTGAEEGHTIMDEGLRDGPAGLITGTAILAKFMYRLRRGSGSGTLHAIVYGKNAASVTNAVTLNSSLGYFDFVTSNGTHMPNSNTDEFLIGMRKATGGREIFAAELACSLAHIQPALPTTLADAEFPDQNYYVGPLG